MKNMLELDCLAAGLCLAVRVSYDKTVCCCRYIGDIQKKSKISAWSNVTMRSVFVSKNQHQLQSRGSEIQLLKWGVDVHFTFWHYLCTCESFQWEAGQELSWILWDQLVCAGKCVFTSLTCAPSAGIAVSAVSNKGLILTVSLLDLIAGEMSKLRSNPAHVEWDYNVCVWDKCHDIHLCIYGKCTLGSAQDLFL